MADCSTKVGLTGEDVTRTTEIERQDLMAKSIEDEASVDAQDTESTGLDDPVIRVRHLVKHFRRQDGSVVRAIDDVSIDVSRGEFIVLLGPSGCGKTTLLRTIAGLERPDRGSIQIDGRMNFSAERKINIRPEKRRAGMIFQSYALWPHMTAFQNVAYPLQSRRDQRISKQEVGERVRRMLELVGIPELEKQHPNQMSGGQQQRVALARALVGGDNLVLFDEPLSNVDAKVREQLRLELLTMQRELGFSALYVTHDQVEAMELATRIAVMGAGKIVQLGSPREVYERPVSPYVANFIGSTNEFSGIVETGSTDAAPQVRTDLGAVVGISEETGMAPGSPVIVVCRPERTQISETEPQVANSWLGKVEASLFVGSHTEHVVRVGQSRFRVWTADPEVLSYGAEVWVSVQPENLRVLRDAPKDTVPLGT